MIKITLCILLAIFIVVQLIFYIDDKHLKKRISEINTRLGKFQDEEVPEIGIMKIERLLDEMDKDHKFKPLKERFYVVYDGKTISVFVEEDGKQI